VRRASVEFALEIEGSDVALREIGVSGEFDVTITLRDVLGQPAALRRDEHLPRACAGCIAHLPETLARQVREHPNADGAVQIEICAKSPGYDEFIDRAGVAVRAGTHCAMPLLERFGTTSTCRASFALYNTRAEIDALAEALKRAEALFS